MEPIVQFVSKALSAIRGIDIPLLGIAKGANPVQVSWCIDRLLGMGLRSLAVPRRELARMGRAGKTLLKYMLRGVLYSRPDTDADRLRRSGRRRPEACRALRLPHRALTPRLRTAA